ncbi:polyphosphate kinase 1 [Mucilaginibacter sp. KACC 22063]|uniref:polyphosphate kinase 1 n=1 Tax=Mucilaginibacter sp. KACC 22063 TaxID=3025666 RepID=UPI0023670BB0|nr:polyphosphate kinase 1 [Mucilaginibacter sp. KACC 22063]WDF56767.1 polyphosphate kinase 1 [Mucilaginibacter sp. KACC 22063]
MLQSAEFFNRDISWLAFNGRVLEEAAKPNTPLIERVKFLGIFSSNLDEFYRVRMPVLKALEKISKKDSNDFDFDEQAKVLHQAGNIIHEQQVRFGDIFVNQLIPGLREKGVHVCYSEEFPDFVKSEVSDYFLSEVMAFLQPVPLDEKAIFFPENNKLYFIVQLKDKDDKEQLMLLNIPSDQLPRFFTTQTDDGQIIFFLDDIIRYNMDKVFRNMEIISCYSFKITRDAELDLKDEYPGDLSEQIEKQLSKRDAGLATRFLFEQGLPLRILEMLRMELKIENATTVEGARYHNLKDLVSLPVSNKDLAYDKWPPIDLPEVKVARTIAEVIEEKDLMVHAPYQSYHPVLRFFNEAAINPDVVEINVTLYRVASDSRIVNALISAAKNGKKVNVVVELKARFDEANNLKWAKKMKAAGVSIIYSITALKIHAKIALVKTKRNNRIKYTGLLATGNLNEGTARFYTDHILLTANTKLLREVELLFIFLAKRQKVSSPDMIGFEHLLVAQFNLQSKFLALIDREIGFAKQGLPAQITIKMNNLEEEVLINKLYEASQAGVKIALIVRSICRLIPGVAGMSENINIRRIVDRYLEHGRVFIFGNNGNMELFMGSADWMNRNIYHRIEVCFPVYDEDIKKEMMQLIDFQLNDNVQAVRIDDSLNNVKIEANGNHLSSQRAIYQFLQRKN